MTAEGVQAAHDAAVLRAALLVGVGGVAWGLDLGAVSGALEGARHDLSLSSQQTALAVSIFGPGELIGGLAAGLIGDRFGRVKSLMLSALVIVVMALTTAVAPSPQALIACRFGAGIGAGLSFVAHVAWASDIAPAGRSGSLTSCFELAVTGGFLATFAVFASGAIKWRGLFLLPAAPALLEFILLIRAPESAPWSLVVKGPEAAKAAHTDLYERWASTTVPPYEPQAEKLPGVASWSECRYWWPAAVAFVMQSFLTFFTGGFTLFIFVVEIIEAAGGSRRAAGVIVVLFGVAKLLATLGVVAAIDDTDRRPLLAVCCVVLALANGAFSLVFSSSKPSLTLAAILVIVMATAFPPAFGARPRPTRHARRWRHDTRTGALNFVLLGELFPPAVKARLVAIEMLPAAFFKFLATYGTSRAIDKGDLVLLFGFQSVVAALGALVAWVAMPETRGRTPRQIRAALTGRPDDGSPVPSRASSLAGGSPQRSRRSNSPRPRPVARGPVKHASPSSIGMV